MCFARILHRQTIQGFVHGEYGEVRTIAGDFHPHIQRDFATTPLGSPDRAGVVHQDLAHEPRGDAEEMGAIFEIWMAVACQAQPRFVYQGCRLQGKARILATNTALCDPSQLVVDQRSQLIERGAIAVTDADRSSVVTGSIYC